MSNIQTHERCYTIAIKDGGCIAEDEHGCLKYGPHNDAHISKLVNGKFIEWKDDYTCECGCWDDENDLINCCKVYSYLTKEEVIEKLKEKWLNGIPPDVLKMINE